MKKLFNLILSLFFIGLSLQVLAEVATTTIPPISTDKLLSGEQTLKVGSVIGLPPLDYVENNQLKGMDVDTFRAIAQKANIKNIEYVQLPNLSSRVDALKQGKVDVILDVLIAPEYAKEVLLTTPIEARGGITFLYLKNTGPFKTPKDLQHRTVGGITGAYTFSTWLPKHTHAKTTKGYDTLAEAMDALKRKEIDLVVTYYTVAQYEVKVDPDLAVTVVKPIKNALAVRKQDVQLHQLLDKAIRALQADGTLSKIKQNYLPTSNAKPNKP